MSMLASVTPFPVIPAQAGTHRGPRSEGRWVGWEQMEKWVPAFAGMTGTYVNA